MRIYQIDDIAPLSVNDMFRWIKGSKGRRYLNPAVKEYKEKLKNIFSQVDNELGGKLDYKFFHVTLEIYMPKDNAFLLNGSPRRFDATNYIKFVEDAFSEYSGLDDKYNISATIIKLVSINNKWCLRYIVNPAPGLISADPLKVKYSNLPFPSEPNLMVNGGNS